MKIWITKYALTQGILEMDAKEHDNGMAEVKVQWGSDYFHGEDWHRTPEAAKAQAELMRQKKIKSLERQLAKLKALTFLEPSQSENRLETASTAQE